VDNSQDEKCWDVVGIRSLLNRRQERFLRTTGTKNRGEIRVNMGNKDIGRGVGFGVG